MSIDRLVCSANICMKNGLTNRPVSNLYSLKVCDSKAIPTENNKHDRGEHNTVEKGHSSDDLNGTQAHKQPY